MAFNTKLSRYSLLLIIFCTGIFWNQARGQSALDNLSFTISGGVNWKDNTPTTGLPLLRSNFNKTTVNTPAYGLSAQYKIFPLWSVETGFRQSIVRGTSNFKTTINTVSLKNYLHIDSFFPPNPITSRVRPFLSAGAGYDFISYRNSTRTKNFKDYSFNGGIGIDLKFTDNFSIFGHYEYHRKSDAIDNGPLDSGADFPTTLTGGIRISLSSSKPKPRPVRRNPSPPIDYASSASVNKKPATPTPKPEESKPAAPQPEEKKQETSHNIQKDSVEHQAGASHTAHSDMLKKLDLRMDHVETAVANIKRTVDSLAATANPSGDGAADKKLRGSYVQVFASYKSSSAQRIRRNTISYLQGRVDNSIDVEVSYRHDLYHVMVGNFNSRSKATKVRDLLRKKYSDAFLITLP